MRITLVIMLLLFTSGAVAQTWQCDARLSHGSGTKADAIVTLVFDNEQATLTYPEYSYTSGKLDTKNQVSIYAEQEASDLSNERITTSRMFRFELGTGHLIFFDHTENHLLITAECRQPGTIPDQPSHY